jgi:hypothetical protein
VLWIEVLILPTVAKVGDSSDDIFELAVVMSDEDWVVWYFQSRIDILFIPRARVWFEWTCSIKRRARDYLWIRLCRKNPCMETSIPHQDVMICSWYGWYLSGLWWSFDTEQHWA